MVTEADLFDTSWIDRHFEKLEKLNPKPIEPVRHIFRPKAGRKIMTSHGSATFIEMEGMRYVVELDRNPFSYSPQAFFEAEVCPEDTPFLEMPERVKIGLIAIKLGESLYDLFLARKRKEIELAIHDELKAANIPACRNDRVTTTIIYGMIQKENGREAPLYSC